jgi:hypothetical protein
VTYTVLRRAAHSDLQTFCQGVCTFLNEVPFTKGANRDTAKVKAGIRTADRNDGIGEQENERQFNLHVSSNLKLVSENARRAQQVHGCRFASDVTAQLQRRLSASFRRFCVANKIEL